MNGNTDPGAKGGQSEAAKSTKEPAKWPKWAEKIQRDFEAIEGREKGLVNAILPAKHPRWLESIWGEVLKVYMPAVKIGDLEKSGPYVVGAMMAHQHAIMVGDEGMDRACERAMKDFEAAGKQLQKLAKGRKLVMDEAARARKRKALREFRAQVKAFCRIMDRKSKLIPKAMALARKQDDAKEVADFFRGFSRGLDEKVFDSDGELRKETTATKVYLLMVMFWRYVRHFPNVTSLHQWMCRVLGAQVVGDVSRVQQICKRHGVVLARPGRPRKKHARK